MKLVLEDVAGRPAFTVVIQSVPGIFIILFYNKCSRTTRTCFSNTIIKTTNWSKNLFEKTFKALLDKNSFNFLSVRAGKNFVKYAVWKCRISKNSSLMHCLVTICKVLKQQFSVAYTTPFINS